MHSWLRFRQPRIVLVAALLLTAIATVLASRWLEARQQALHATTVEFQLGRLNARMDAYVALLRATRALMQAQAGEVDRRVFRRYVERLRITSDFPGIQGIGYSPRVAAGSVAAFEEAARKEGIESFAVHPAGAREWMFSILYLEPLDERNRAALGFDMSSEPVRAAAMARARDTGSLAMSGPVVLKQEIDPDKKAGFLVYVPLYGGGSTPATLEERRARSSGFVYAPFRAPDFFDSLFDVAAPLVAVRVHAGAPGEPLELLHDGFPRDPRQWTREITVRSPVIGGQPWTLEFMALPGLAPRGERLLVPAVAVTGGLISALLFLLARLQLLDRVALERSAAERAEALSRERAQRHLAESLSGLALLSGSEPDAGALMQRVVDEATRLTGATCGVFLWAAARAGGDAVVAGTCTSFAPTAEALARLRSTSAFAAALTGRTLRLDDLRAGSGAEEALRLGLAPEQPAASGLAACVCPRQGRAFGALFFLHAEPGYFTAEHERLVESLAAQAAVMLENATLRRLEREAHVRTGEENTLLETFVGIASHDLRNPLNVILLNATLLERSEGVSANLKEATERIKRSGARALRLVHDLLDFTQVRLGKGIPVEPVTTDVHATVRQLVEEFRLAHPQRGIVFDATGEGLGIVDPHRLAQMMSNLITNALVYGAPGTPVTVGVEGGATDMRLSVRNEGEPITEELRGELFRPLRRGTGRSGAPEGSIGLGLFIVEQIVQAHRGRIDVASDASATTFTVRLPRHAH
ncbi:MAG: CHASE domain-containing protein [Methylibium sp.]|nr:CHASE domain-containing protein [Methylibium sp.]